MADQTMTVSSELFKHGDTIPDSAAHDAAGGQNVSPDLRWEAGPEGTQSYTVTCYDPDAPTGIGFVHWVLFNIDADTTSLDAGAGADGKQPPGSVHGFTDWGESQYGGMAPPPGDDAHHYHFTVQALDVPSLDLGPETTYAKLRFMTREHVLAEGTLTGLYAAG